MQYPVRLLAPVWQLDTAEYLTKARVISGNQKSNKHKLRVLAHGSGIITKNGFFSDSGFFRIYFLSTLGCPIKQPNEMKNSSLELYATRFEDKERMFSGFSRNPDRFFRICLPCYADSGSGKPTPKNLLRNARGVESKHLMLLSTHTHNLQIYIIIVYFYVNNFSKYL